MRLSVVLVVVAACGESRDLPPDVPPDAPPVDPLKGLDLGPDGQAGFALEFGHTSRPIAERADAGLFGRTRPTAPLVATVTSDDPTILVVTDVTVNSDDALAPFFTIGVHAAGSGDTDLVLRDAGNAEIDRVTLHVRPTDTLAIDRPWGSGDALLLAGEVERIHVTTFTGGVVTAGSGAAEFTLAGDLALSSAAAAPWFLSEGDQVFFIAGSPGAASVVADAPNTTTTVGLSIVPPSALTAITRSEVGLRFNANDHRNLTIGATANGVPVYGPRCTWTALPGLTIELDEFVEDDNHFFDQTGWIGADPAFIYTFEGTAGTYQPTCTLPGGLQTTISVVIDP